MSHNVHGHALPEPFRVNEDNPVFQRHQPEHPAPEVPAGLHGAPALRSELESPVETKEYSDGTAATGTGPLPDLSPAQQDAATGQPSAADLDAVAEEQEIVKRTGGRRKKLSEEASTQDPIPDHEDEPENLPEKSEVDTGATDPEFGEDREEEAAQDS